MKRPRSPLILLALVLVGVLSVPAAASTSSLLLRFEDVSGYDNGSVRVDQAFIYRDGLMLLTRDGESDREEVYRRVLDAGEMATLNELLAAQQIGVQEGACALEGIVPDLPANRELVVRRSKVSWFGRGARVRHLPVDHGDTVIGSGFETPCAGSLWLIFQEVAGLITRELVEQPPEGSPRQEGLLLEVLNHVVEDRLCGDGGFEDDIFIFRDGLMIRRLLDVSGVFRFARAQATEPTLHSLKQILAEEQIGFQGGSCRIWFFLAFIVEGGCLDFSWSSSATWFGRGERRSTIIGSEQILNSCTMEQQQIARGLDSFIRNTLAQPPTTIVQGRFP